MLTPGPWQLPHGIFVPRDRGGVKAKHLCEVIKVLCEAIILHDVRRSCEAAGSEACVP
jgi:hypothetical protein